MKAKFIKESFKEESDPIHDMGIGVIKIREFDSIEEAADIFIDNIKVLTKGQVETPEELKNRFYKATMGITSVNEASPLKLCRDYIMGWDGEYPRLKVHNMGYDTEMQSLQFLKDFKDTVKDEISKRFRPKIHYYNDANESFKEESDPIKDMGIGTDHYIYGIEKEGYDSYNFNINTEKLIKYIKKCIPEISENEIERFLAFTMEEIYDSIDGDYFELNDLKRLDQQIERAIMQESRTWMKIHSDHVMKNMMRRSG